MEIKTINGHTRVLNAPENWDQNKGECVGLPVLDTVTENGNCMISEWQPEPDDLKLLNMGMPLHLWIYGTTHPVVSISVGLPTKQVTEDFAQNENKNEWQLIECAPEDQIFLMAQPDDEVSDCWQIRVGYKSKQYSDFVALGCRDFKPTHWMAMPTPPRNNPEAA